MPARIEEYALIGDLFSCALVSRDGSIDWLCVPRFDSPACFAALLGTPDNGRWKIAPASGGTATRRRYRGDTLILETEWDTPEGTVRVVDFMPERGEAADVVRIIEGVSGRVPMRTELKLRFVAPALVGTALTLSSRLLKAGQNDLHVRLLASAADRRILVVGEARLRRRSDPSQP